MTFKVLVTDYAWPSLAIEREVLGAVGAELLVAQRGDEAELIQLAPQCDAILTNWQKVTAPVLDAAQHCLIVSRTLTEAVEAYRLARSAGWGVTISARSGETEDIWLADLAVGWAGDFIKIGSITHGERLAKYNRLLAIEAATGLPLVAWPNMGKQ